jgi:hypothetical protein
MNWKKTEEFYIDTGEKKGNYKLLQCKVCVWAFENAEEQGIIVDETQAKHKFERRIIQLEGHIKRCPYKSLVPLVPGISSPTLSVASGASLQPSDSASGIKRKRQSTLQYSSARDSVVDKQEFERHIVNVVAATGVSFKFFENDCEEHAVVFAPFGT